MLLRLAINSTMKKQKTLGNYSLYSVFSKDEGEHLWFQSINFLAFCPPCSFSSLFLPLANSFSHHVPYLGTS
jgi:hypothetical protein